MNKKIRSKKRLKYKTKQRSRINTYYRKKNRYKSKKRKHAMKKTKRRNKINTKKKCSRGGANRPENVPKSEWDRAQRNKKAAELLMQGKMTKEDALNIHSVTEDTKEKNLTSKIKDFIQIANEADKLLCSPNMEKMIIEKIKQPEYANTIKRVLKTIDHHINNMSLSTRCSTKMAVSILSEKLWRTYNEAEKYIHTFRDKLNKINGTVPFRGESVVIYTTTDEIKSSIDWILKHR